MNNEKKQLPKILLPDGSYMPKMGQGTWKMGEDDEKFQREVDGLKYGMSIGNYSLATAAGIFKSVISLILVFGTNAFANRLGESSLM